MAYQESICTLHRAPESRGERKLLTIIAISLITMVGEIVSGTVYGSLALLADGWHMGTHVLALGIAFAACVLAKRIAADRRFGFGPAKVGALGGFAGAILLGAVAFEMLAEGIHRLLAPESIQFTEAMMVAGIGLVVNAVGALLLHDSRHFHHAHEHGTSGDVHHHALRGGHGHDVNMRSAYLHVITDALTSVMAIVALLLGQQFGWIWADAAVAMLGGVIILRWAYGLLRDAGATLLDFVPDKAMHGEIEAAIRGSADNQITDLHIWPQGNEYGVLATVKNSGPIDPPQCIHERLRKLGYLDHITIEVRAGR
jgi:cation diffusion facilitator family transporter